MHRHQKNKTGNVYYSGARCDDEENDVDDDDVVVDESRA